MDLSSCSSEFLSSKATHCFTVLWPSLDALGIGAGELVQGNADALATAVAVDAKVLCLHPGSFVSSVNLCK